MPPLKAGTGRSAGRAIAFLSLAAFAAQAMVRVTDSLLPQIAADFHVTVGAASIVVTAYLLAHGSVQLIIGPIGDRFGKYLCLSIAAVCSTVMVIACGFAPSLPVLVAVRLGSGLATGWIVPFALAFMGDVIPYERRQQVIGRFLSGQILGQLFGQTAGGVLGDLFGWRNVFFLLAGLLAVAAGALFTEYWRNPLTHSSAVQTRPQRHFIADYAAVLRSRWALAVIAMAFLESGLMFGAFTYVGADLHHRFGVSFALVGLFVGTFAIGGLIYSLSVHMLIKRLGAAGLAACGGVLLALAYATLAFEPHYAVAPLAITVVGLGFYMLHNTLQTNATQMTPEARGTAVSIFSAALYLGQTAAVAVGGVAFDRFGAVPIFLTSGASLLAVGLWLSWELRRRAAV
ncbi:MAG TPA: MFS transporter [Pseudolabrys sp.]|nr:MFS transporter [Pseudolabrys sp.]